MNNSNFFTYIMLNISCIILFTLPTNKAHSYQRNWLEVEKKTASKQMIDINSLKIKNDGEIKMETHYETKSQKDILYTMKIDCNKSKFIDVKINNIIQKDSKWKDIEGDKLIETVLNKTCSASLN